MHPKILSNLLTFNFIFITFSLLVFGMNSGGNLFANAQTVNKTSQTTINFTQGQEVSIRSRGQINLRDKDCKVVGSSNNGDIGKVTTGTAINCQIGRLKYKFYEVDLGDKKGFVKWSFVKSQSTSSAKTTDKPLNNLDKIKIATSGSVNFRDKDCKVIGKLAKNKEGKKMAGADINCQIGSIKVRFVEVEFDGKKGYVGANFVEGV